MKNTIRGYSFILLTSALMVVILVVGDSFIESYLFDKGNFYQLLFNPAQEDVLSRALVTVLIIIMTFVRLAMMHSRLQNEKLNQLQIKETERDKKEIQGTLSLLNATLDSTMDGILVVGQNGRIERSNIRFAEMWRIPESILATGEDDQAISFVLKQLVDPGAFVNKVNELYNHPEKESFDVLEFKDGRTFERYSQPQCVGEKIVGRVWSFRDVTTRKQVEKELEKSESDLRVLFGAMNAVVIVYDREGRYIEIAPTDHSHGVGSMDQLLGKTMYDVFPAAEADRLIKLINVVLDSGEKMETEYYLHFGGKSFWFNSTISPMQEDRVIWVAHDITERKRNDQVQEVIYTISQAAISTDGLDDFYSSIHTTLGALIHLDNFYIALYNPIREMLSFPYYVDQHDEPPPDTKPGRGLTEHVLRTGKILHAPRKVLSVLIQEGEVDLVGTMSVDWLGVPLKVGEQIIGVMVAQSYQEDVFFSEEDLSLFEFVSTQVAQMIDRKRVEEKIRFMGFHDALTGLYNRAYFDEELKRLERGRNYPVSILMADVDNLKIVNDQQGHAAGDQLLRLASQVLRSAFRQEDVIARIGGDEFAIILPGIDEKQTQEAVTRIRKNIKKLPTENGRISLEISIGTCTAEKGSSLIEALRLADDHMYTEKQSKS